MKFFTLKKAFDVLYPILIIFVLKRVQNMKYLSQHQDTVILPNRKIQVKELDNNGKSVGCHT